MSIKSEAIAWVKDYFAKNGNSETKAVIGISGGKDSATVAALCCAALGKDRVIGVMMPNGVQADIEDSKRICKFLGIKNYTVNIEDAYRGLTCELKKVLGVGVTPAQYNTNTPARLRMATLYSIAAIEGNCRVSNNGNKSECLVGYFTLWGDGSGDFAPLANLYVSEVIKLGLALGLPEEFVKKAPSDGMSGMTDEDKLGFTYADLEKVARGKTEKMDPALVKTIKGRIKSMAFKKKLLNIPNFIPSTAK